MKGLKRFYYDDEKKLFVFLFDSQIETQRDPNGDSWEFFIDNEDNKQYLAYSDAVGFQNISASEYEEGTDESESYFRDFYIQKGYTEIFSK